MRPNRSLFGVILLICLSLVWIDIQPALGQTGQSKSSTPHKRRRKTRRKTTPKNSAASTTKPTSTTKPAAEIKLIATLETNYGTIKFELLTQDAPKTTENFRLLANKGYYTNVTFHRVINGFMIQGGDPTGTGAGGDSAWGGEFEDEIKPDSLIYQTGYQPGIVAMANRGPNTNSSQFFIMHKSYGLPPKYTIFGRVIQGQEVVDTIATVPTDRRDRPLSPVIIKSAKVE